VRNDIDLKYFKKCLEERLEVITAGQEDLKKETAPVELDQARVGRLSRMDAMQQQAMSQAVARLTDFMKLGDYGYCVICDEEIAEGRLRFDPSILTCISCAKDTDKR
jgi:DnaK suppressor protein